MQETSENLPDKSNKKQAILPVPKYLLKLLIVFPEHSGFFLVGISQTSFLWDAKAVLDRNFKVNELDFFLIEAFFDMIEVPLEYSGCAL